MDMDALYQKRLRDGFPGGDYTSGIRPQDQAEALREFMAQPILTVYRDGYGNIIVEGVPRGPVETHERYATKLAFARVRDELKTGGV